MLTKTYRVAYFQNFRMFWQILRYHTYSMVCMAHISVFIQIYNHSRVIIFAMTCCFSRFSVQDVPFVCCFAVLLYYFVKGDEWKSVFDLVHYIGRVVWCIGWVQLLFYLNLDVRSGIAFNMKMNIGCENFAINKSNAHWNIVYPVQSTFGRISE